MRYLLCELDAESYSYPEFTIFDTKEEAIKQALFVCANHFEGNETEISVDNNCSRICVEDEDNFYVTEIFEFDETKGDLLVWHHAYDGVDFKIELQGTYEECDAERKRQIQSVFDECDLSKGDNEGFNIETANVVDTGNEWEVWSIVEVTN